MFTMSLEDVDLLTEAVGSEIEHTRDMIREMPDTTADEIEAIRTERIREDRFQALFDRLAAEKNRQAWA